MARSNTEVVFYTPNYRQKIGFFQTWVIMFRNIIGSRELIIQLFRRDFLMSYKKSFLGMTWILVSPIIGIASWVLLNSAGVLRPGELGIPYPAYVLLSSSIWGLFVGFYSASANTLNAGAGFIMQVKYPHEALLVKETGQHLANFSITFIVNIAVLLVFGIVPDWRIIFFPILILPLFFIGAGLGLIVSVVGVVASDVGKIVGILMTLLMYLTPVVYAPSSIKDTILQRIVSFNPLTYVVGGVRDIILYGHMEHPDRFLIVAVCSLIFFLFSWRLFFVSEDKVIEKMI